MTDHLRRVSLYEHPLDPVQAPCAHDDQNARELLRRSDDRTWCEWKALAEELFTRAAEVDGDQHASP